ncbi:hypothetical protein [Variovorax sp. DAIF25]|uniref:hypothetical protein n=1 Tax=Variovorax sp. DAIF25 TaxID=3080983 RepID=UPI003D6BFEC3
MTTDIHAATQAPPLADIVHDLRGLHAQATPGVWSKGQTTHHTVSRVDGLPPYRIAEFHHAKDASFCDAAHMFLPTILAALEARDAEIAALTKERDDARRAKTGHFSPAYLLENARRLAAPEYAMMPNWALATQIFAVGSTTAHAICRENGIDPDSKSAHEAVTVDATPAPPTFLWREPQRIARQIREGTTQEQRIAKAQAEVASWPPEKLRSMQLQGEDSYKTKATRGDGKEGRGVK